MLEILKGIRVPSENLSDVLDSDSSDSDDELPSFDGQPGHDASQADKQPGLQILFYLDDDAYSDSGISQTTFGTSATEDPNAVEHKLRRPPIPKEGRDGFPFECPFCFLIITVWRNTYTQTSVPTPAPSRTARPPIASSNLSISGSSMKQRSTAAFGSVLMAATKPSNRVLLSRIICGGAHTGLVSETHLAAFTGICERKGKPSGPMECAFCGQSIDPQKRPQKHIGRHHQQLALFVLPAQNDSQDEDEDENNKEDEHETNSSNASAEGLPDPFHEIDHKFDTGDASWIYLPAPFPDNEDESDSSNASMEALLPPPPT
ncbi:uncharacterized protein BDZ99DRAFT_503332 [Mytilinidion resinicola]|uniref:C2H2-type domain-containing protein n=1 Tax=Mytilinidion resinicola TaxID=574789 RepID=A0A6A6Y390_9PEZI|nr:uncharacterized protein BDZ99DRAFT_503332 [Mytilinidion resinicola]KAF2803296.1 hypothetical protein BDZ99DRAFT_503332 [Mytilinidion resinicola]